MNDLHINGLSNDDGDPGLAFLGYVDAFYTGDSSAISSYEMFFNKTHMTLGAISVLTLLIRGYGLEEVSAFKTARHILKGHLFSPRFRVARRILNELGSAFETLNTDFEMLREEIQELLDDGEDLETLDQDLLISQVELSVADLLGNESLSNHNAGLAIGSAAILTVIKAITGETEDTALHNVRTTLLQSNL